VKPTPRQWLALALLGLFLYISGSLAPYFVRDLRLQRYLEEITRPVSAAQQSAGQLRTQVIERAHQLGLPVEASDVQVELSGPSVRISVRYLVRVDLPGYTVKLHFAPDAGR
jgi:hypothetical protein